jgi:hypothetical protein
MTELASKPRGRYRIEQLLLLGRHTLMPQLTFLETRGDASPDLVNDVTHAAPPDSSAW